MTLSLAKKFTRALSILFALGGVLIFGFVAWTLASSLSGKSAETVVLLLGLGALLILACGLLCFKVSRSLWRTESPAIIWESVYGLWLLVFFGILGLIPGRAWSEALAAWFVAHGVNFEAGSLATTLRWIGGGAFIVLMAFIYNRFFSLRLENASEGEEGTPFWRRFFRFFK